MVMWCVLVFLVLMLVFGSEFEGIVVFWKKLFLVFW